LNGCFYTDPILGEQMKDSKKGPRLSYAAQLENARVGYQAAMSTAIAVDQVIWSIFNTMIVANSIVVAGIGLVITNQPSSSLYKILLSIIGVILCFVWFFMAKRHRDYFDYLILSAREIEEKYFSQSVVTVSRSSFYSKGQAVVLRIGEEQTIRRMSFWSRLMKGEVAAYTIIIVFVVIYVSIIFI
jgi:amino acid permease